MGFVYFFIAKFLFYIKYKIVPNKLKKINFLKSISRANAL